MGREVRQPENTGRVLRFEPRNRPPWRVSGRLTAAPPPWADHSPVNDVAKYEAPGGEPDDYRHRQITNAAALLICTLLAVTGVWLAIKIAELRRDQDCVLAGRRNCAQISIVNDVAR